MLEGIHAETEYELDLTGAINWEKLLHYRNLALDLYTRIVRSDIPVLAYLTPLRDVSTWVTSLPQTLKNIRPVDNFNDPDPDDRALIECLARVRAWEVSLESRVPPILSILWPSFVAFLLGILSSIAAALLMS